MSRPVIELETGVEGLVELAESPPKQSVRLVFSSPRRGGPPVAAIRRALSSIGRVRVSATHARVHVDFDPNDPEAPLVALDTIVRSDAAGLERMILSALPLVDEIVLGIDGRSDQETFRVAEAYADCVYTFKADDIGMSAEDWSANKIDFAAARNLGRARVHAPWTLVVDSDEYVAVVGSVRDQLVDAADDVGGFSVRVRVGSFEHHDVQRLTRTRYRWTSATHNQLIYAERVLDAELVVVQDLSLREVAERERRDAQRDDGINALVEEAAQGNIMALFHLAKHRAGKDDVAEAVKLVEDYRLRLEPHGPAADERVWLALAMAFRYYNDDDLIEADRWAVRALLDGPCLTALCLLGDIAEDDGDLIRARGWYEAACAVTEKRRIDWPGVTELRFGRLAGIQRALEDPAAPVLVIDETIRD